MLLPFLSSLDTTQIHFKKPAQEIENGKQINFLDFFIGCEVEGMNPLVPQRVGLPLHQLLVRHVAKKSGDEAWKFR